MRNKLFIMIKLFRTLLRKKTEGNALKKIKVK